jgi:hypothetical protein
VSLIPYWVGSYTRLVGLYLDGGSPYRLPLLGGVVLSTSRGAGMASDQVEGTVVPSVLAGSMRRACSLSQQACLPESDLSPFLPRVGTEERSCDVARCAVKAEEVVADSYLSAWPRSTHLSWSAVDWAYAS